jgi:hypothetical protein
MVVQRNRSAITVSAFVILLILCSPRSSRAQRHCCEGDTWIKWTEEHREDYVRGYILGRAEGYSDACYREARFWPSPITLGDENNPISRCLKEMPDFSQGPEHFAKQVTELYRVYPEDRILLITEILEAMGSGKSIQDIHEHPPFPTPGSFPKGTSRP